MENVDMKLTVILSNWGYVELTYVDDWVIRNQTDEGLGVSPLIEIHGTSPSEAIDKAFNSVILDKA